MVLDEFAEVIKNRMIDESMPRREEPNEKAKSVYITPEVMQKMKAEEKENGS